EPWASFLVGGGAWAGERVELWDAEGTEPFFRTSGASYETMQRVVVDLGSRSGKMIFVRLVDEDTGGWGHINFDSFRFHAQKPGSPRDPSVPETRAFAPGPHAGLAPKGAVKAMTVPPGFQVELIASEPEIHQPIAFTFDAKGRIWLAEAFTYPVRAPEGQG